VLLIKFRTLIAALRLLALILNINQTAAAFLA